MSSSWGADLTDKALQESSIRLMIQIAEVLKKNLILWKEEKRAEFDAQEDSEAFYLRLYQ